MFSRLMWRKMLVAFLSAFVPLLLGSVILTLEQISSGDTNWKLVGLAFLTTGVLPAVVAGARAILAQFFTITPTDALHGKDSATSVGVTKDGAASVPPRK